MPIGFLIRNKRLIRCTVNIDQMNILRRLRHTQRTQLSNQILVKLTSNRARRQVHMFQRVRRISGTKSIIRRETRGRTTRSRQVNNNLRNIRNRRYIILDLNRTVTMLRVRFIKDKVSTLTFNSTHITILISGRRMRRQHDNSVQLVTRFNRLNFSNQISSASNKPIIGRLTKHNVLNSNFRHNTNVIISNLILRLASKTTTRGDLSYYINAVILLSRNEHQAPQ